MAKSCVFGLRVQGLWDQGFRGLFTFDERRFAYHSYFRPPQRAYHDSPFNFFLTSDRCPNQSSPGSSTESLKPLIVTLKPTAVDSL